MLGPITATTAKPPFADGGHASRIRKPHPDDINIWSNRSDRSDGFIGDRIIDAVEPRAVPTSENPGKVQPEGSDSRIVIIPDPAALSRRASGRRALTIEIAGGIAKAIRKQQFTARAR